MIGEEGAKACSDFLHSMKKIEEMTCATQEEVEAIKDVILNMEPQEIITIIRKNATKDMEIVQKRGDDNAPILAYSVAQTYLLLKILDRLESIDDSLIVLMQNSNDEWDKRNNK
jgi:hypothetical protein